VFSSRISSVIASEAKQSILSFEAGLLRVARNDGVLAAFPVFALPLLAGI